MRMSTITPIYYIPLQVLTKEVKLSLFKDNIIIHAGNLNASIEDRKQKKGGEKEGGQASYY